MSKVFDLWEVVQPVMLISNHGGHFIELSLLCSFYLILLHVTHLIQNFLTVFHICQGLFTTHIWTIKKKLITIPGNKQLQ